MKRCYTTQGEKRSPLEQAWANETIKYLNDPTTKVFIHHNNESGEWLYSVVVENSGGFWLDSFKTRVEAERYIQKNNLSLGIGQR